ncbi:ABC transporter substrate-binding protein [Coprothermobacteraceae bacterium]|nr:ABC transporter substrate-binding protein [Coprothermobacteraceae bacterium]
MRTRMSTKILLLVLVSAMLVMSTSAAVTVKDDVGATLTFGSVPKRVLSLAPNMTEIMYALGVQGSLMGRTPADDYPPEVKNIPIMGDYTQPNLEILLTKNPDLILATKSFRKDLYDVMVKRWKVYVADPQTIDGVSKLIHDMGVIFQRPEQAARLEEHIRLTPIALQSLGGTHPSVLLLLWNDPPMSVGKGTFVDDLLNRIGLRSVTAEYSQPWPTLGEETLLRLDPDLILYPSAGMGGQLTTFNRKPWTDLAAVKNGKLIPFTDDYLFRPGPRITKGMVELYLKVAADKPASKVLFVSTKAKIASLNGDLLDYTRFALKNGRFLIEPKYAAELGIKYTGTLRNSSLKAVWVPSEQMGVFLLP